MDKLVSALFQSKFLTFLYWLAGIGTLLVIWRYYAGNKDAMLLAGVLLGSVTAGAKGWFHKPEAVVKAGASSGGPKDEPEKKEADS